MVLLSAAVCRCHGADIVWTNTSSSNWSAPGNWSPNQVPGLADNVFITNNGTYTVTVNASATIVSLTLGGTSGTHTLLLNNNDFPLNLNGAGVVNPKQEIY